MLLQAGGVGEHAFVGAATEGDAGSDQHVAVDSKYLRVRLGPSAQAHLRIGINRFAHQPSYQFPVLDAGKV